MKPKTKTEPSNGLPPKQEESLQDREPLELNPDLAAKEGVSPELPGKDQFLFLPMKIKKWGPGWGGVGGTQQLSTQPGETLLQMLRLPKFCLRNQPTKR